MLSPYSLERVEGYRATAAGKRPKLSLASLIGQAILSSPEQKARLSSIYEWIADRYPEYYQMNQGGWQNSIRHNLTINKAFVRLPKAPGDQPGKGAFWTIHPDHLDEFKDGVFVGKIRGAEYRAMPKNKTSRRSSNYTGPVKRHPDFFPEGDYEYTMTKEHGSHEYKPEDTQICDSEAYGFSGPPPVNTRLMYGNVPSSSVGSTSFSGSNLPGYQSQFFNNPSNMMYGYMFPPPVSSSGPMWQSNANATSANNGPLPQLIRSQSQYSFGGYSNMSSAPGSPPLHDLAMVMAPPESADQVVSVPLESAVDGVGSSFPSLYSNAIQMSVEQGVEMGQRPFENYHHKLQDQASGKTCLTPVSFQVMENLVHDVVAGNHNTVIESDPNSIVTSFRNESMEHHDASFGRV